MFRASSFAAASLLACLALPAAAQTAPAEKQAIEAIVRDYLLAHPEVIEEAMEALRVKREAEAALAQTQAIEDKRDVIFNSSHQTVLGNPQGAISLVEFFDYNCGYCKRALGDMTALIAANPDLRVVIKEFPILSQGSADAARLSVAVKDVAPEKYLDFHTQMLTRPGEATADKALEVARELGIDEARLTKAANADTVTANLTEVQGLAASLGISGTPSYVVGQTLVPGAAGYDALQQMVTAMRQCGKTAC